MRQEEIEALLDDVRSGTRPVNDVLMSLKHLPVEDIEFATVDTHRELRQGFPEVIFAEGKSSEQVAAIAQEMITTTTSPVIATRVPEETATLLTERFATAIHHPVARIVVIREAADQAELGTVTIVTAGTSDLPIAEEAAVIADTLGASVDRIVDVGVAGLHRILRVQDRLHSADVVIVVAGMDGVLPSLVGGITAAPVIAVPTSVGYGASFDGLAALLTMLNSCAAGVTVTNIDNGFGAAVAAIRILNRSR